MANGKRRKRKRARAQDEDDAFDDAREIAENAAEVVEMLTRPGMPPDTAAMLYEPLDLENLEPPPRLPHDRELILGWIGQPHPGPLIEDAFRLLGHKGVWWALAFLESPDVPVPTASLIADGERHRNALDVLIHAARQIDERSWRVVQTAVRTALLISATVINSRLQAIEGMLRARTYSGDTARAAATNPRGARGTQSGPARLRRFLDAARPLTDAGWTRQQIAELVVNSGHWTKPPCRRYVADLLDDHDGDRTQAMKALASRITDAGRRRK